MPLYDFRNKKTNKSFEKFFKIAEKDEYLKANPHIVQEFTSPPAMIDPVRLGIRKVDNGFKEVLRKVHEKTPGSNLNNTTNF